MPDRRGRMLWAAGTNCACKGVIAGEFLAARSQGAYFNPDLVAKAMTDRDGLTLAEANTRAWNLGFELLNRSIERNEDFSFETTLGGNSITQALMRAAASDLDVYILYVGLDSADRHIDRVAARVTRGGHPIPAVKIRERYPKSLANLIKLLACASEVRVYDNCDESARRHATCSPRAEHVATANREVFSRRTCCNGPGVGAAARSGRDPSSRAAKTLPQAQIVMPA